MGQATELVDTLKRGIERDKEINSLPIFLCRRDGVLLHAHNQETFPGDIQSAGALMSSVWQAAEALADYLGDTADVREEFFRLSFDTSEKGVYVLPLFVEEEMFFLGAFFKDHRNPALVKNQLRHLVRSSAFKELTPKKETNQGYLFENITDDEIDQMFSFVEE